MYMKRILISSTKAINHVTEYLHKVACKLLLDFIARKKFLLLDNKKYTTYTFTCFDLIC